MNYIILDLEWDSAYHKGYKRFINQILQIGAIKLDYKLDLIDTFEVTVKSDFSKKVSGRFATLTGIKTEDMLSGVPLLDAVERYNAWVGDNTVTMTWSTSDIFAIIENEELLLNNANHFKIEKYLDLQKFTQGEIRKLGTELKNQISLGDAAEMLGVSAEGLELHTAKDDSMLAAEILKKIYNKESFSALVEDTKNREFYEKLRFKSYPIKNINDENIDKKLLKFNCPDCNKYCCRLTKWKYRNRWFTARFVCKSCKKEFKGKISAIKTFDSVVVRKRIVVREAAAEKVQNEL